jgi:hypothetical protein
MNLAPLRSAPETISPSDAVVLLETSFVHSPNMRETLGLRPALRQAALVCRRGRRRGGAAATRQRSVAQQAPYGGLPAGVCSPLPRRKGSAACLRDIPCGNVVSRWTLVAIALHPGTSRRPNTQADPRHFDGSPNSAQSTNVIQPSRIGLPPLDTCIGFARTSRSLSRPTSPPTVSKGLGPQTRPLSVAWRARRRVAGQVCY